MSALGLFAIIILYPHSSVFTRAQLKDSTSIPYRWGHTAISVPALSDARSSEVIVIGGVDKATPNLNTTVAVPTLPTLSYTPDSSLLSTLSTSGEYPATLGHACTYVAKDRSIICIGGYSSTETVFAPRSRRGLHKFVVDRGEWTALAIGQFVNGTGAPENDVGVADAAIIFDGTQLVVLGGRRSCYTCPPAGTGTVAVQGTADGGLRVVHDPLDGLYGHCAAYHAPSSTTYVLFGSDPSSITRTLTLTGELSLTTVNVRISAGADDPRPRLYPTCTYSESTETIYIFGGLALDSQAMMNDLWSFHIPTQKYTQINTSGNQPSPRTHASLAIASQTQILLHGGLRADGIADPNVFLASINPESAGRWQTLEVVNNGTVNRGDGAGLSNDPAVSKFLTIGVPIIVCTTLAVTLAIAFLLWRLWRKTKQRDAEIGSKPRDPHMLYAPATSMDRFSNDSNRTVITSPPRSSVDAPGSSGSNSPIPPARRSSRPPVWLDQELSSVPNAQLPPVPSSTLPNTKQPDQRGLIFPPLTSLTPAPVITPKEAKRRKRSSALPLLPPNVQSHLSSLDLSKPYPARQAHFPTRTDEIEIQPDDLCTVRKVFADGWVKGCNVYKRTQGMFPLGVLRLDEWNFGNVPTVISDVDGSSNSQDSQRTVKSPASTTLLHQLEDLDYALSQGLEIDIQNYLVQRKRLFYWAANDGALASPGSSLSRDDHGTNMGGLYRNLEMLWKDGT
ncbi:hypothetical protein BC832DRAFT_560996 [Gaertneriomyces semiglobifer]|nr:hypothetical protein BC832DRAFT_560996 [Gaertneriomyces semiglobifer]